MKCKECEYHDFLERKGLGLNGDYRSREHYCISNVVVEYPTNKVYGIYHLERSMFYKDFIKTPEWCPKIQKTFTEWEIVILHLSK